MSLQNKTTSPKTPKNTNIVYITPYSIFTINPFFYYCFYSFLICFILAWILFFSFIGLLSSSKYIDKNSNDIIYYNVNKGLITASLFFSIISLILITICFIYYIKIFGFPKKQVISYLLLTFMILSFVIFIVSIYFSQKKFNICPENQVFSTQYDKCIPICDKGSIYNPDTNQCVIGCKTANDCEIGEFCCFTNKATIGKCALKENKCGNDCCNPNECIDNFCCPPGQIITNDDGDKICCNPNFQVVDNKCVASCGNTLFDPNSQQCNTIRGSCITINQINDNFFKDSSGNVVTEPDGTCSLSYISQKSTSCSQNVPSVYPDTLANFFTYVESNKITSNYFCRSQDGKTVYWANTDNSCNNQDTIHYFTDATNQELLSLYSVGDRVFCGTDPKGIQALLKVQLNNCSSEVSPDICLKNAYSNSAFIDTSLDPQNNTVNCFYTLIPPSSYSLNPYSLSFKQDVQHDLGVTSLTTVVYDPSGNPEEKTVTFQPFQNIPTPNSTQAFKSKSLLSTQNQDSYVPDCTEYQEDCSTANWTQECCPSAIQNINNGDNFYFCKLNQDDQKSTYGSIQLQLPPDTPEIVDVLGANIFTVNGETLLPFNHTFPNNTKSILVFPTLITDDATNLSTIYVWRANLTSVQSYAGVFKQSTSCIFNADNNAAYFFINQLLFSGFVNPSIMQCGMTNGGGNGNWTGNISFPHEFPSTDCDSIIVIAGLNGTKFDAPCVASVQVFNVNCKGFDYKKQYCTTTTGAFSACDKHYNLANADVFNWFAINMNAFRKTGNDDIIQAGNETSPNYNGYSNSLHFSSKNPKDDIVIITTVNAGTPANWPAVVSVTTTGADNKGFGFRKLYTIDNQVKKLGAEPFYWLAIDKTKINMLKNIFL